MRGKYLGTFQESQFPKPRFHIIMLFIDEDESVRRQLLRGQRTIAHNAEVDASESVKSGSYGKLTRTSPLLIVDTKHSRNRLMIP